METVGAFEAKTFAALLDRVEQGEKITITRNGVSFAMLVPMPEERPSSPMTKSSLECANCESVSSPAR
jgi:antitoxin (DNA-binding transcriptional repressor) of toxin-antitoxin stability system